MAFGYLVPKDAKVICARYCPVDNYLRLVFMGEPTPEPVARYFIVHNQSPARVSMKVHPKLQYVTTDKTDDSLYHVFELVPDIAGKKPRADTPKPKKEGNVIEFPNLKGTEDDQSA